ncbi:MAG: DUF4252 domain-containing protein [Bacteroidales bacterium]|nr:DUF4252 domain-containing protein [Bacteroidales bacterium]MCF8455006.1 DUF4252 domain-containing protein [Bacteroidales bacterium]
MPRRSKWFLFVFALGLMQPLFAQQDILKTYADTACNKKYCFYPSTLRMINLAKNEDYNKMVEGIEKLLVYTLDSTALADKSYRKIMEDYLANDFEEYANMWGGKTNFSIYGKEGRVNELTGTVSTGEDLYVFYLIGNIDFAKIPAMIQSFKQDDMINIFTLNSR